MLKKVDSSQLRVGMYIHDLDCGWMEHPFVRNRFAISSEDEIRKIMAAGIRGVTIDCARGLDVADAPTVEEAAAITEAEVTAIAAKPVAPLRTGRIQSEALGAPGASRPAPVASTQPPPAAATPTRVASVGSTGWSAQAGTP